jgi:hypothetical protein
MTFSRSYRTYRAVLRYLHSSAIFFFPLRSTFPANASPHALEQFKQTQGSAYCLSDRKDDKEGLAQYGARCV